MKPSNTLLCENHLSNSDIIFIATVYFSGPFLLERVPIQVFTHSHAHTLTHARMHTNTQRQTCFLYFTVGVDQLRLASRVKKGDRPDLQKIDVQKAAGLDDLVAFMKRCWHAKPNKRPSSQGKSNFIFHVLYFTYFTLFSIKNMAKICYYITVGLKEYQ